MTWIRVEDALPDHAKTLSLADKLDIPDAQAVGHLVTFWLWAAQNAVGGSLTGFTPRVIARAARWPGDAQAFVAAMIEVGFIDQLPDGSLQIHDWMDHQGKLEQRKERDRERKRRERAAGGTPTADHISEGIPQDVRTTSDGQDADSPARVHAESAPYDNDNVNDNSLSSPSERAANKPPLARRGRKLSESPNPTGRVLAYFGQKFESKFGAKPHLSFGKDGTLAKNLVKQYGEDLVRSLIDRFFELDDDWVQTEGGYTFGVFVSQINKLLSVRPRARAEPEHDAERARIIAELKAQEEAAATGTEGRMRPP